MKLQSLFIIITSTTVAITTILECTVAQAFSINGEEKLQVVSTLAYSQNLFFVSGIANIKSEIANTNSSEPIISNVDFTPQSLIFNSSGQLGNSLFTSNYNSTYNFNSDTVIWNQQGVLGSLSWSSYGTASFLDDNQTIVWNYNNSIDDPFEVGFSLTVNNNGNTTFGLSGEISHDSDPLGYSARAQLEYNKGKVTSSVEGSIEKKIDDKAKVGISTTVSHTSTGGTTGSITAQISSVPEPLTIFGSGIGLGFGVLFNKKYSRKQKKVKSLEKQKA